MADISTQQKMQPLVPVQPHIPTHRDPLVLDLNNRVVALEKSAGEDRTRLAVMQNDLSYVKKEIGGISTGINRILWAFGLAAVTAVSTFVLSGGLSVTTNIP